MRSTRNPEAPQGHGVLVSRKQNKPLIQIALTEEDGEDGDEGSRE